MDLGFDDDEFSHIPPVMQFPVRGSILKDLSLIVDDSRVVPSSQLKSDLEVAAETKRCRTLQMEKVHV